MTPLSNCTKGKSSYMTMLLFYPLTWNIIIMIYSTKNFWMVLSVPYKTVVVQRSGISGSAGADPYEESPFERPQFSYLCFLYFRQTLLLLSRSHFCSLNLVCSTCGYDWMPIWFKTIVVQPAGSYCTLSAVAIDWCWNNPNCTLLNISPSICIELTNFSEMLVVLYW